jgi:hypothetical protein
VIEILSMVLIVALFLGLSLRRRANEIGRERRIYEKTAALRGRDVTDAKSAFGEPVEIVFASSGWRLYIWRLEEMEVTATVDPASVVTDAGCQVI